MPINRSANNGSDRGAAAQPTDMVVPDFGSFMRLVFPENQDLSDATPALPDLRSADDAVLGSLTSSGPAPFDARLHRDYDTALTLLERASDAFPTIVRHCQHLEVELQHVRAEALSDVEAAHRETQQWQQIAVAMKMHIEESEHQLNLLRGRLAAAEERLAAGHTVVAAAEQQANFAMGITTLFHDKIMDAFGVGSPAHSALDSAAQSGLPTPRGPDRTGR